jgi:predicted O-methyltransferase YrrM
VAITILSCIFLAITVLFAAIVIIPVFFGAPWHPTSTSAIKSILTFCGARPGEKIYDLGSGDGRVLITAAGSFGMDGVGIEIDPVKVWISRLLITRAGLRDRVKIHRGAVSGFDYSDADILFIYLSHQALDRLFPRLLSRLKPGVKIVCYRFCPKGMAPTKVNSEKTIFLYQLNKGNKLDGYS